MSDDGALRRLAIQIACQLPEDREDAKRVLDYARYQLLDFLSGAEAPDAAPKENITVLGPR
jgi:hypothetical protein